MGDKILKKYKKVISTEINVMVTFVGLGTSIVNCDRTRSGHPGWLPRVFAYNNVMSYNSVWFSVFFMVLLTGEIKITSKPFGFPTKNYGCENLYYK